MVLKPHNDNKKRFFHPLLLAFLIPFLGMLTVMAVGGYAPFGSERALLYSDEYHQYYPFFVSFRRALLNGESLLYRWDVGMGLDYLGVLSYYLASPLNLLSVLVPESMTLQYFALLSPIKLGLASLFFALFLKKLFDVKDYSVSIFGAAYGLCAWALGYQWNIMWLDTFALLPLVMLGMVYLLRDKKFVLYTVSLCLSVLINYYIGFFTCIFVVLGFLCYEICCFCGIKRFLSDLGRIALFSVLAIGMTAFLTLPAWFALQDTYSSINVFPENFALNIADTNLTSAANQAWEAFKAAKAAGESSLLSLTGLWFTALYKSILPILDGMRQVAGNMGGAITPSFKEGLPNLFCGVGSIYFGFLFLTAPKIKLRERICCTLLLIFLMLSFIVRQLDYIWHGFHFTNMIPYRFSFLFSFVLLYMAYRAWLLRDEFKLWQLIFATLLSSAIIICSDQLTKPVYLIFNFVFLAANFGLFLFALINRHFSAKTPEEATELSHLKRVHFRRQLISVLMCLCLLLEVILSLVNFGIRFSATNISNYPYGTKYTASILRYLNEREKDSDFYRTEVTHYQTLNDGALNGYHGISLFSSSANVRVTEFTEMLGCASRNSYNRYCYEETSPVTNLFLNLKYLVERKGELEDNPYLKTVHSYGDVYLLENQAYLPLGFLAESSLADSSLEVIDEHSGSNNFFKQNYLFKQATGIDEPVWNMLSSDCLKINGSKSLEIIKANDSTGYSKYATAERAATLRYTYTMEESGFLCLDLNMTQRNTYAIYKNNEELFSETVSLPKMIAVGEVKPGDVIYLDITCKSNISSGVTLIRGALLDSQVFDEGYRLLSESTLDITKFTNTRVDGTIHCKRDGLLYTSIPYDENWVVTLDGEPVEPVLVGDAMMAIPMTEGRHNVSFRYKNTSFIWGTIISLVSLMIFLALILIPHEIQKNQGKYLRPRTPIVEEIVTPAPLNLPDPELPPDVPIQEDELPPDTDTCL